MANIIIVGVGGQDGRILTELLKGNNIIGLYRNSWVDFTKGEIYNIGDYSKSFVSHIIKNFKPDFLYYLAGYHHSSEENIEGDSELIEKSNFTHFLLYSYFLEAIKTYSPKTRVFYAASSLLFGFPEKEIQDEGTPINPRCIYGITKASGFFMGRLYRENYNIFVANGILYNHESKFRKDRFLFPKVIKTALSIKRGMENKLILGNLDAVNDWGYAYDYIDAMIKILNLERGDDFIIATGEGHTVREFVDIVFSSLNLSYRDFVIEKKDILIRKKPVLIGNPTKLIKATNWKRSLTFKEMVLKLVEDFKNG